MIVLVGDIGWDFVVRSDRLPLPGETVVTAAHYDGPGGGSANTAATIASTGAPAGLIAAVGRDWLGDALRRACSRHPSLSVELAERDGPTQFSVIVMSSDGERTVVVRRAASFERPSQNALRLVEKASWAWINEEESDARRAYRSAAGAKVGLPLAHLDDEVRVGHTWDVIVGSAKDHAAPAEAQLRAVAAELCVLTEGAAGGRYWTDEGGWVRYAAEDAVAVEDTLGAGDAFLAGLLIGLDGNGNAAGAVRMGASFGSKAVTYRGAWPAPAP